ncbi:MAG TPA: polysaccharide deacetylase family protein [Streptosporangiaceae bacterium]
MRRTVLAAGLAGLALAHVGPAATWLPAVRRHLPGLAGVGDPAHVALTFDDGPDAASTPLFLDALHRLGCQATFFVLGPMLRRHHDVARRIVADGHEIGVHGWSHVNALRTRPGRATAEITRTAELIGEVCGVEPRWYRPPYGVLSAETLLAARRAGLRPVLWTCWGRDWTRSATPATVLGALGPGLRGGGTVLLHDCDHTSAPGAWRAALGALPRVVEHCRAARLAVGPLRDHGIVSGR